MSALELVLEAEPHRDRLRVMTRSHAVDLWLGELARKGLAPRTIDTYRRLLNKWSDEDPRADIDEATATQVRRFLDQQARLLRDGGPKAKTTIAQNVTIMNGHFDWLTFEGIITRNPTRRNGQRILARPKQLSPDSNDNIVTVSGTEVARLLQAAEKRGRWNEHLAVACLAYLGPRRHALALARITDYDANERTLSFCEKGGKTIAKPVPHVLADLIDAAIAAGVYVEQWKERGEDYLIPGRARQRRLGDRDDRVIWHLVREVAKAAGVTTHVHALRAAFAVEYLETHPGQTLALQELMGHKRPETTQVYLRRLNRRQQMETVRDMDWGRHGEGEIRTRGPVLPDQPLSRRLLSATQAPHLESEQTAGKTMEAQHAVVAVDLEPSINALLDDIRPGREHGAVVPGKEV